MTLVLKRAHRQAHRGCGGIELNTSTCHSLSRCSTQASAVPTCKTKSASAMNIQQLGCPAKLVWDFAATWLKNQVLMKSWGLGVVKSGLGHQTLTPLVLHCFGFWMLCRLVWGHRGLSPLVLHCSGGLGRCEDWFGTSRLDPFGAALLWVLGVMSTGLGHRGLTPLVLHCFGFWVLCRLVWDIEA